MMTNQEVYDEMTIDLMEFASDNELPSSEKLVLLETVTKYFNKLNFTEDTAG